MQPYLSLNSHIEDAWQNIGGLPCTSIGANKILTLISNMQVSGNQFFYSKCLPCDEPSSLPKYFPSKELDARLQDEEARRQTAGWNKGPRYDVERKASMMNRRGQTNSWSEKFPQEEVSSCFRISH